MYDVGGRLCKVRSPIRPLLVPLALLVAAGCGGASDRPAGRNAPLSDDAIADWGGERAPARAAREAPSDEEGAERIELADGDELRSFVALVQFEGGASPVCAVYALRSTGEGLSEGRRSVACPAEGLAAVDADGIPVAPVEEERLGHLTRALAGARPHPEQNVGSPSDVERITVRVITDRRTIEGPASPAEWPSPAEGVPEPTYDHDPATLSQLYEAVMYPHRFQ